MAMVLVFSGGWCWFLLVLLEVMMVDFSWLPWLALLVFFVLCFLLWPEGEDANSDEIISDLFGRDEIDPDNIAEGDRRLFWSRTFGFYSMPVYDDHDKGLCNDENNK